MRIVFVISTLGPGGAERSITQLARRWGAEGHEVVLVTLSSTADHDFYPLPTSIKRVSLQGDRRRLGMLGNLQTVMSLAGQLRVSRPDAVVSFIDRTNIISILAGLSTGVPVLVCERTVPHARPIGKVWEWLRKSLYPRASHVVVQSLRARERLSWCPTVTVIPNSVEPPDLEGESSVPLGRYIVIVGRFTEEKRHDMALRVFARLRQTLKDDTRLVCIGDGPLRGAVEAQAALLGVSEAVIFTGNLSRPHSMIAGATCLLSTSRVEGFPMAVAEAMALGVPVVVTDSGGAASDLVRHGVDGLMVPPDDEAGIEDAIVTLMREDALRREMGSRATEVLMRFSPKVIDAQWFTLLEKVLKDRL